MPCRALMLFLIKMHLVQHDIATKILHLQYILIRAFYTNYLHNKILLAKFVVLVKIRDRMTVLFTGFTGTRYYILLIYYFIYCHKTFEITGFSPPLFVKLSFLMSCVNSFIISTNHYEIKRFLHTTTIINKYFLTF